MLALAPINVQRRSPLGVSARGRKTQSKARFAVKVNAANADLKFDDDWKKSNVAVHLASLFGWVIPSASPCPAFPDNASLFKVFSDRISENLAHFPTGPSADDPIWLYMLTWHMGLFACMMFGQIGVQARKQGYFGN
ncbi:unnamed product [Ostreococcus tauri]|uniref:Unnamed product n=1 Tax=Ostreococcus tauri TaxID=70448 RepID=A0A096P9N0_OSTTA|nr:unnamed product [Ostreococcus tauri]7YCA_O Chain O, PsaO [Ostreococcus tauri]CEG01290.1 unnamed product [Ostreococcus tauri]|eukprot:XP_022840877.1 unnamed product [Ostreococcus tauri]